VFFENRIPKKEVEMQDKIFVILGCIFGFVVLIFGVFFSMNIYEQKAMIPILEARLAEAGVEPSQLADQVRQLEYQVRDLQDTNEELARQLWDTELSYRNVRLFVWSAELDLGNEECALTCFDDFWNYQATEADISGLVEDQTYFSSFVPEIDASDPQLEKALKAYFLKDSLGLAYQLGYQCNHWESLHRILEWILTEAPEVFDLGYYYEPFVTGTMVLNHGAHHALFVLANSDRSEDQELVSRIIREIPLHQPLFISLVYNMEVYLECSYLKSIPDLPKNLQAMARQRALQEWERAKGQVHPEELDLVLASPVEFEGTKTHRELLVEVLGIKF
jgi:hypothetical protein